MYCATFASQTVKWMWALGFKMRKEVMDDEQVQESRNITKENKSQHPRNTRGNPYNQVSIYIPFKCLATL